MSATSTCTRRLPFRTAAAVRAWDRSAWRRTWRRICRDIRSCATGGEQAIHAVSAAPWGSASILLISYGYIRMLGADGLTDATRYAILNANYIKARLEPHYPVLYARANGRVAHELIFDLRAFKAPASRRWTSPSG